MTAHTPVTDAPPGGLWRAAALAWLLVVIAVGVHQWQFWTHDGIDTDVMALLPVNEQAPDVALATEQLVGQMSRQVVVLLGAGEWGDARAAAQLFRQGLATRAGTRLREDPVAQKTSMEASLGFYQPWRERLLTPAQRGMLAGTPDAALVQKALQDLYQPAVQARLSDWVSDPLGLWTQWWTARGAQSQARPRDGELWVAADGQQWAVLQFTLEGSAFRLSGEPVLGNALQGALADAQAQWPGARMVTAGVPLHAEAAAVQANWEIDHRRSRAQARRGGHSDGGHLHAAQALLAQAARAAPGKGLAVEAARPRQLRSGRVACAGRACPDRTRPRQRSTGRSA